MGIDNPLDSERVRRRALAKAYEVLIQLAEEFDKQTALPDNFGEEAGKAEEQTPTEAEIYND